MINIHLNWCLEQVAFWACLLASVSWVWWRWHSGQADMWPRVWWRQPKWFYFNISCNSTYFCLVLMYAQSTRFLDVHKLNCIVPSFRGYAQYDEEMSKANWMLVSTFAGQTVRQSASNWARSRDTCHAVCHVTRDTECGWWHCCAARSRPPPRGRVMPHNG